MGRRPDTKTAILSLMEDGIPRTALEIATAVKGEKKYIRALFAEMVDGGAAHIPELRGRNNEYVYKMGAGKNIERPANRTPEYLLERKRVKNLAKKKGKKQLTEREIDRLYRASDAWWPRADPLVTGAMLAMVRVGVSNATPA
jgi:hypothetical protein